MSESTSPAYAYPANGVFPAASYRSLIPSDGTVYVNDDQEIFCVAQPIINKTNENIKTLNKVTIGYGLVAAYPIVKLAIAIITGAAITATPANIILLVVLVLWLASAAQFVIQNRSQLNASTIARIVFANFAVFATAPVSLPLQFIYNGIVQFIENRREKAAQERLTEEEVNQHQVEQAFLVADAEEEYNPIQD